MRFIGIILLVLTFNSCKRTTLSMEEYFKYLNSNEKFSVTKEFNGILYKLKLQPPELMTLRNSKDQIKNTNDFHTELEYYKDKLNFVFLIEDASKNVGKVKSAVFNKQLYATILEYANTDLKKDLRLIQNGDTLYCAAIHLESANSLQPVIRLSLGFTNLDPNNKNYTLVFNDNIFNNGPLKFNYSSTLFDQLPELKM